MSAAPTTVAGALRAGTEIPKLTPVDLAGETPMTAMRVLAENFQDSADSIEQVTTAAHGLAQTVPDVPSAVGQSGLIGVMTIVVLIQKLAQLIGG